jgi:uncharacterized membrane protein
VDLAEHRRHLMIRLGLAGFVVASLAASLVAFYQEHRFAYALAWALGAATPFGAFGVMLGHLEATAEPPHRWFAPKGDRNRPRQS